MEVQVSSLSQKMKGDVIRCHHWAMISVLGKRMILFGIVYWLLPQQLPMGYEQNSAIAARSIDILDTFEEYILLQRIRSNVGNN